MNFFFVSTGTSRCKEEIEVIKLLQPDNLMCSYHYFKNIPLQDFIQAIGYKPKRIFFDSGAYSAWSQGKEVDFEKYLEYIKKNRKYIWRYMCLDKLGDTEASFEAYQTMKVRGFDPIPVFHYMGNESVLQKYIDLGERFIALGGTVPIKNKHAVAEWVKMLSWMYPEARYHLLGSAAKIILNHCDIDSADASTWIMQAIMGKPEFIPGRTNFDKIKRAIFNMNQYIKRYDEKG